MRGNIQYVKLKERSSINEKGETKALFHSRGGGYTIPTPYALVGYTNW